jgi:hypothetical protein
MPVLTGAFSDPLFGLIWPGLAPYLALFGLALFGLYLALIWLSRFMSPLHVPLGSS